MTNSKWVTLQILWKAVSSNLFPWPTACEWHCRFCERQSHHIFSYVQQTVSDIADFVKGSLITSFPMTNREWVIIHILWKAVSSNLFPWPTACEWHCRFCERQSHHIFSYVQQTVSDVPHFMKGSMIKSFPMTNSLWVTLQILWKAVLSHLFLWPTASKWHCRFCERQSCHIFSYDQQGVSDVPHFMEGSIIKSFPMTNSKWVTLQILWKAVSSHLFLCPTASEWHCRFCERQSHHISSYVQQHVSDIPHSVKGSFITYFPLINSLWVALQICWPAFLVYLNSCTCDIHFIPYWNVNMLPYPFHVFLSWSLLPFTISLSFISRWVVMVHVYSPSHTQLAWTIHNIWRNTKPICSQGIFVLSFLVVHNWSYCNKPTSFQILVCKLLLFIYSIYAYTFKQLSSLLSYPFGSINHLCHQSQRPWINTSKKAMLWSWRQTLLLAFCALVIKILSHYSIGRWLILMVCTLSSNGLVMNTLWQDEIHSMPLVSCLRQWYMYWLHCLCIEIIFICTYVAPLSYAFHLLFMQIYIRKNSDFLIYFTCFH